MTELLTESFCERCGTRYTFESQAPKRQRLTSIRTLSRGLRNYVLSDDTSLDEAMAAARNDDERAATSEQLEAFHQTFNFCMTCRQYTCANCWNEAEGRCLSCAPDLSREVLDAPFPNLVAHVHVAPTNGVADHAAEGVAAGDETDWPAIDVASRLGGLAPIEQGPGAKVELEAIAAVEPDTASAALAAGSEDAVPAPEPEAIEAAAVEAPSEPKAGRPIESTEDRRRRAARQTAAVLAKFRPGLSLDEALAAYEASLDDATTAEEPAAGLEPVAVEPEPAAKAVEPEPAPVEPEPAPVEPEPVAVEPEAVAVEPEPAPVAAAAEPAAEAVEPEPGAEAVATDHIPQPTWPAAAPTPATTDDGHAGSPAGEPTWPASPSWPVLASSEPPTWPGQPEAIENDPLAFLLARRSTEDLWAASNREVVTTPAPVGAPAVTVQNCTSCGLSLSATARFCRRCGARQEA
jgi:hypothetical protein